MIVIVQAWSFKTDKMVVSRIEKEVSELVDGYLKTGYRKGIEGSSPFLYLIHWYSFMKSEGFALLWRWRVYCFISKLKQKLIFGSTPSTALKATQK